jgi:hypothetical protein
MAYTRGRVEIANNRATIYLNPRINRAEIVEEIKTRCGWRRTARGITGAGWKKALCKPSCGFT